MAIIESDVQAFFGRYAKAFADGLEGSLEVGSLRALYATQYIAAGPTGVMAGNNDDAFGERMSDAYENYRRIGTKAMTINAVRMHPIDETHCLAHVDWNSEFEKDGKRINIPFTNTYLIERNDGALKVFGWITGDEVQLLKDNGLL